MIYVEDLTKYFPDPRQPGGRVAAVDRISFQARPGEVLGLLGPNGAGKTTTMRLLCTVLKPSSGTIRLAGFDVVQQPTEVRQHLGFLSANTALYERMSAWELVEFFARLYGLTEDRLQQRMEYVFQTLQMNDFRDVLGMRMSTGMRQKVSIARAIVHDPPVLIFDEPTMGLDVMVARNVLQTIAKLRDLGKCIVYSTHIMREVEKLCDRVAIIARGRIQASGTLAELRAQAGQEDLEELFFKLVLAEPPRTA